MRSLVVSTFTSLDGCYAGTGGEVMALPFDPTFDEHDLERVRRADTLLVGRTTFEQLMAFWVPFADDPRATALQREVGRFPRDVPKVVVSDGLPGRPPTSRSSDARTPPPASSGSSAVRVATTWSSAAASPGRRSCSRGSSTSST